VTERDHAVADGVELEYELRGTGMPVVLIHNGVGADWWAPLLVEPALADGHRVLTYHRAGFRGSGPLPGPLDFAGEARRCGALMRAVGLERAHVVGHSSSAMIALQLALDDPDAVQSLALLESARPAPQSERQAAFVENVVRPAMGLYRGGDTEGAVKAWLLGVGGPGYRATLDRLLPGAIAQAVAEADLFFGQELPAVQQWEFTREDADRVAQPALLVLGMRSEPVFAERRDLLRSWLPDTEDLDLEDATHLLHLDDPRGMAEGLAAFFARHPPA
jgi:pimeloyl-ACP methyl ester carboxylesterase